MLLLHASFEKEKLLIWAEKQFAKISQPAKSRRKQPLNPPPKQHPFAADVEQLEQALVDFEIEKSQFVKSLAWLPANENAPLPSNSILGSLPDSDQPCTLSPWALWACVMDPAQAANILFKTNNKEMLGPAVLLGNEFRFLSRTMHFILSLLVRQRYLPSIKQAEGIFESAWSPIFLNKDKSRLLQLETSMPDICRCLSTSLKQTEPPNESFHNFLHEMIDCFVRTSLEKPPAKERHSESAHDAWLASLQQPGRILKKNHDENATLQASINQWQQSLKNILSSPFKLCLRIEEPKKTTTIKKHLATADTPWEVSYLLQAYDDPSLLVTTKDVWNPKGVKRKVLERPSFNPRQFVLSCLGSATRLCTHIESSLQTPIPTGFSLDSTEASRFFTDYAPQLEEAGFGIICPNWWKKKKLVAKATVESSPFQAKRERSIWDDLNTDWQVYLGDLGLSQEELYQLALLKDPIVKMRGEWVLLQKEDILKALEFLKKKPYQPKNALDLLHLAAGIPEDTYGISIEGIEASGWVADFLGSLQNNSPMQALDPPKGFMGTLRPYQMRGYSWMSFLRQWQVGACLADDMGLGKTPQTLAMIMRGWEETSEKQPTLLICPTSLTGNWEREAAKFVPDLPVQVHHGSDRKKGGAFAKQIKDKALVITSYALLQRDEELFKTVQWAGIILDEAQNIKNTQTKQTKAAHKLQGQYRLALTGTPVENNVGDLWSIMHFLNPGYLGSHEKFKATFFNKIQIEKDPQAASSLKQLTKPLVLRRLKTDRSIISDLPEKMEMKVYCQLSPEQITLYETVVADANGLLDQAEGIERKGVILATLSKLKQICNHPVNFLNDGSTLKERSGKLTRLLEMLEEITSVKERCLIFTQYAEMGHLLKKHLEEEFGSEVLFLHGGTSKKNRDIMVERFQKQENSPSIFILSLKAGGVGLNLTRANHVFHFDRWWNPAIENQATDRAFRIGQTKNVQVHKFICTGSIEERIDQMIENKKEIAATVIGTGEGWLTELSTDSLKELWKLQTSALQ
ncbi:MAG TPA: DEAD/DEAH box helicase [Rhabdochlamydiaceae bacterium]|nr:DEAD/DEAH box helicase [Rhabdochlamydiaceae bacterium]